ncbi:helix-turn-helix transcriptional regulator [Mangrovicoccus sp. HB161399]|uniref:ArsR/SmtB family transcription factor n=1 Tax=Mangrovicoccus sp. HB161399 TaxID=2720392 RepID=UPI001556A3B1|nr:helix-turn-helix transcriptional regulator [Mangrovicoccus sp. HB161399]
MDKNRTLAALSALGHETRLDVFRLLVQTGEAGLAAGEIGTRLGVRANTLSANLWVLSQAGMIFSRREGRSIRYFADMEGMRGLLGFLMEDCCGGNPGACRPALDDIFADCAAASCCGGSAGTC